MQYFKPVEFTKEVPIIMYRPITTDEGEIVRNTAITDRCEYYNYDEIHNCDYFGDIEKSSIRIREDDNGRLFSNVCQEGSRAQHLARVALIAFDEERKPIEYYKKLQADHINPSIPLDNNITNLRWTTHAENMINAGESGVMIKKYNRPLIREICRLICEGVSRENIMKQLGVNGQLIDDVRSGRSHKSVSREFLDKGFEYKSFSKAERREYAHKICKLFEQGYGVSEVNRMIEGIPCKSLAKTLKARAAYKEVTDQYEY